MFCHKCGKKVEEHSSYCKHCGTRLKIKLKEEQEIEEEQKESEKSEEKEIKELHKYKNEIKEYQITKDWKITCTVLGIIYVLLSIFFFSKIMPAGNILYLFILLFISFLGGVIFYLIVRHKRNEIEKSVPNIEHLLQIQKENEIKERGEKENEKSSGGAVAGVFAFIFGLISFATCWIPVIGFLFSICAIISGGTAMGKKYIGLGLVGVILGTIFLIISIITTFYGIAAATIVAVLLKIFSSTSH